MGACSSPASLFSVDSLIIAFLATANNDFLHCLWGAVENKGHGGLKLTLRAVLQSLCV